MKDACLTIEANPLWDKGYIRKSLAMMKMHLPVDDVYEEGLRNCPESQILASRFKHDAARIDAQFDSIKTEGSRVDSIKSQGSRVTWNEPSLAQQSVERGVLYGKMKIDQPDTPFLIYDKDMADNLNLIGTIENRHSEPTFVNINELQAKLGILEILQDSGKELRPGNVEISSDFKEKRKQVYQEEGAAFVDSL